MREDEAAFRAHADACRERGARPEHLANLHLAWAAGQRDPAALRELDGLISAEGSAAARRVDPSPGFADEVVQALRVRLLVAASDSGRARISDYGGRGPLRGWLGVAALRVALNLKRTPAPVRDELLAELVSAEVDPELRYLKTLYRTAFRAALEAALAALPKRQRLLLRLSHVEGMSAAQLGRLYQVHETTAGRWLQRATLKVAADARRRLMAELALSRSSLDSITRLVLSNLDLSIARLLGS